MSVEIQAGVETARHPGLVNTSAAANNGFVALSGGDDLVLGAGGHSAIDVQPTALPGQSGCARIRTYFDLYYNRYHVIPTQLDAGVVTDDKDMVAYVWSAFFEQKTLNSVTVTADGVTTDAQTPKTFNPLELLTVNVHIDGAGAAAIDGVVQYDFADGPISMRVAGLRAVLFEFPMNWAQQFRRSVAFKTDVFTSRSGREQRRSLRAVPRVELSASVLAGPDRFEKLRQALLLRQDVAAVVPDFARRAYLTQATTATGTTVSLDRAVPWCQQGATVVLTSPDREIAIVRAVDSVSGQDVTLTSAIGYELPQGSILYLGASGLLGKDLELKAELTNVATLDYSLKVFPESVTMWDRPWGDQFDGKDVMNIHPNWISAPSIAHNTVREDIDFGWGRFRTYLPRDYNVVTFKAQWRGLSVDKVAVLEDFFYRQKGAARSFWMPSWTRDMTPVASHASTESILTVAGTDIQKFKGHKVWNAIRLRLRDGTEFRRKITDIVDAAGGNSNIVLDNPWGQDIALDDILAVEWLYLARLASDQIEISFHTDEAADVSFAMQALENV